MTLHPDVQARAQAEIDALTQQARLPSYADRPALPYLDAVIKEIHRWQPVTRLGAPHCCTQDDAYGGYRSPRGAMVFANIWCARARAARAPTRAGTSCTTRVRTLTRTPSSRSASLKTDS